MENRGEDSEWRTLREEWIRSNDRRDAEERLFELEMTLKALDRFFNLDNLAINEQDGVIQRDFSMEMRITNNACRQVARLARVLLKEDSSAFTFQSYVKNKMLGDSARDAFISRHLAQTTPTASLFLLGDSFQNLTDVTQGLTRLNDIAYPIFFSTGQMISRSIASNRFFNPMIGDHFHPLYDRMRSRHVNRAVRKITDRELRREVSVTLLAFYRLLRYLTYIDAESEKQDELRQSALTFALIHSETNLLIQFLEKEIPERLQHRTEPEVVLFVETVDSLAFQCGMELRKVFHQMLRELTSTVNLSRLRAIVSAAIGMLRNFYEQAIVMVVQTFEPSLQGRTLFPDFVSKLEQSLRLREDLYVLNKLCDTAEQQLSAKEMPPAQVIRALQPLHDFTEYFTNLSFKFVRYADHDEFERFFNLLQTTSSEALTNPKRRAELCKKVDYFNRYVETTLGHVRHREELSEIPFESENADRLISQFLA